MKSWHPWPVFVVTLLVGLGALAEPARFTVTGAANTGSTGVDNPYVVLGKAEVQDLAYAALREPLTAADIEARLGRSEVKLAHLLATDVLRPAPGGRYALAFNVGTIADKRLLRRVADPAGKSLAAAILAERPRFDAILAKYDLPGVDPGLLRMALIGAVMLDWDGLGVTADEGYRQPPTRKPNGDKYQMTMLENAPDVSVRALYWGSHNEQAADGAIVVSTFGDHESPERLGFPDIKSRIRADHMTAEVSQPVARALARALYDRMTEHQDNAARMMTALRTGPMDSKALAAAARADPAEAAQTLRILEALRYVTREGDVYRARIPVFTTARDAAMMAEFRALGKDVMRRWLKANYAGVKRDLAGLEAAKAGVPYDILFTQVWHDLFGWTNYHLVKAGYLYDPYGPDAEFVSFVPFVWDEPMKLYEGTKIF